jgi:hypothetical protein
MADYSIKRLDELEPIWEGMMLRARASLGVKSFGMQVLNMPPNFDQYPNHNHVEDATDGSVGQEEVYIPIAGAGTLKVGGQEHDLEPGTLFRVGAEEKRQIVPGPQGVQVICIGGVPGKAYKPPAWTEAGGPLPVAPESTRV